GQEDASWRNRRPVPPGDRHRSGIHRRKHCSPSASRAVKLVPVIDLAGGAVVRAVRGERENYRPIVSRLCEGHDPADIAIALATYCAADTLYVADLDAIRGGALQQ